MRTRSVKFATLSVVLFALSLFVAQCAKGSSYNSSPGPSPTPNPGVTADVTIAIEGMTYSPTRRQPGLDRPSRGATRTLSRTPPLPTRAGSTPAVSEPAARATRSR